MLSEANQPELVAIKQVISPDAASLAFEWFDIGSHPEAWDGHVTRLGQNVFHRSAMLRAHQAMRGFRRGVLIRHGEHLVCAVGGLVTPRQDGGIFRALSFPGARKNLPDDMPHSLAEWLLGQGMMRVHFGSYDGGTENFAHVPKDRIDERLEFLYDLTLPEDQRLATVNSNHKRKLKKAERELMRLGRVDHLQPWVMTWLNAAWSRRHGNSVSPGRMLRTLLFYRSLTALLKRDKSANLYALYDRKGRILSMAYMLERGTSSFYMIGASSDVGYQCGASVRLIWELAREYPRFGITTLNFGGVPIGARDEQHEEHGVYRFKTGFGIEPTLRHSLTIEA